MSQLKLLNTIVKETSKFLPSSIRLRKFQCAEVTKILVQAEQRNLLYFYILTFCWPCISLYLSQ